MDKLIISETDRGRYSVRPMSWVGIWNEEGQIKEYLNHLALFIEKEDAEKFVEWKEAEEQNRLPKLPVAVGDTVYTNHSMQGWHLRAKNRPYEAKVVFIGVNGVNNFINVDLKNGHMLQFSFSDFGKTVFLTKEAAESALKELERGKGE